MNTLKISNKENNALIKIIIISVTKYICTNTHTHNGIKEVM